MLSTVYRRGWDASKHCARHRAIGLTVATIWGFNAAPCMFQNSGCKQPLNPVLMLNRRLLSTSKALTMNRPRNRQQRPPRGGGSQRGGNHQRPQQHDRGQRWTAGTPQQAAGTVPTLQQVVPGASVFIILKEDQPTGTETKGIVQDLLTRGNHPRGIKVRLRGGLVGRVQRMGSGDGVVTQSTSPAAQTTSVASALPRDAQPKFKYRDVRLEEDPSEPPPRSLVDFLPAGFDEPQRVTGQRAAEQSVTVKCPFCDVFEGDEVAVSHHIDQNHLE